MSKDEEEPWVTIRVKKHTQRKLKILSAIKDLSYSELLDLALKKVEEEQKGKNE